MSKEPAHHTIKRSEPFNHYKHLLNEEGLHIWSIYGVGGSGKTLLLKDFAAYARQQAIPCLLFEGEHLAQEKTQHSTQSLLQHAQIDGKYILDTPTKQPKHFITYLRKLQDAGFLHESQKLLNDGANIETENAKGLIIKLTALTIASGLRLIGLKRHQRPEKKMLEALRKDASQQPLVILIDNHDLAAQHTVQTSLRDVSIEGKASWEMPKETINCEFYDWLENIIVYLAAASRPVLLITTGRKSFNSHFDDKEKISLSEPIHLEKESLLAAFNLHDIETLIKNHLLADADEDETREISQLASSLSLLCSANPLLIRRAITLLKNSQNTTVTPTTHALIEIWDELVSRFEKDKNTGFHQYILQRLSQRIPQQQTPQHPLHQQLWRLALAYRLPKQSDFENLLYPVSQANPVTEDITPTIQTTHQLFKHYEQLGIIENPYHDDAYYRLHLLTRHALRSEFNKHPQEIAKLHPQLQTYFEQTGDKEAAAYHRLHTESAQRLHEMGISAEDYWNRTLTSASLTTRQRQDWRFKPLPKTDASVKKRIRLLQQDQELFHQPGMSGDANAFLLEKMRQNKQAQDPKQLLHTWLADPDRLNSWLQQAPHLSDLWVYRSELETDINSKLQQLCHVTDEINPFHIKAWFQRALLKYSAGLFKQARKAFHKTLELGITGTEREIATAYHYWLTGEIKRAIQAFESLQPAIEEVKETINPQSLDQDIKKLALIQQWLEENRFRGEHYG